MSCVAGVRRTCAAGLYGSTYGLSTPRCSGPCAAGYFCPEGSVVPDPVPCGGADRYCPAGSAAPLPVDSGYYSGESHIERI